MSRRNVCAPHLDVNLGASLAAYSAVRPRLAGEGSGIRNHRIQAQKSVNHPQFVGTHPNPNLEFAGMVQSALVLGCPFRSAGQRGNRRSDQWCARSPLIVSWKIWLRLYGPRKNTDRAADPRLGSAARSAHHNRIGSIESPAASDRPTPQNPIGLSWPGRRLDGHPDQYPDSFCWF
jgi:hypothetical protein